MSNVVELKSGVKGRYRAKVGRYDENGVFKPRTDTGWFDNLITNNGLDRMGTSSYLSRCYVGTGSSTPAVTDNDLDNRIAQTGTRVSLENGLNSTAPYYIWGEDTFEFAEGVAAGNLSEVGIGWDPTPTEGIYSRALIVDSGGNPTTITVLSNEILQVTYSLRIYPVSTDATGTIELDGVTYNYTMRPRSVTTQNSSVGWNFFTSGTAADYRGFKRVTEQDFLPPWDDSTGMPQPRENLDVMEAANAYTTGTYQRDVLLSMNLGTANFATGIGAIEFRFGWGFWLLHFSPKIPKTDQNTLSFVARHSWARK